MTFVTNTESIGAMTLEVRTREVPTALDTTLPLLQHHGKVDCVEMKNGWREGKL